MEALNSMNGPVEGELRRAPRATARGRLFAEGDRTPPPASRAFIHSACTPLLSATFENERNA